MTTPTSRNRLAAEDGPYLSRLADDPVQWQPWDAQALRTAREADVPIFLSVGHVTCPWCHRMWTESFRDTEVAALLNQNFVPVAVDRENRPDIDALYQTVCRVVDNEQGWPLSVWLTPECRPFYIGTYFPPENEDWAPGFENVLDLVAKKWSSPEVREAVEDRGVEWTGQARDELEGFAETAERANIAGRETLERIADLSVRTADREHGGWGTERKFLESSRLRLLFAVGEGTEESAYTRTATATLDGIADGAVCDQIGGGFFRAATNRDWSAPQAGKHLDINADVVRAFLAGYDTTGDERYANVAKRALAFVDRELGTANGGFRAALAGPDWPADRSGEADTGGDYYGWTPEAIEAALDDTADGSFACERYGIEQEASEPTIPRIATPTAELAADRAVNEGAVRDRLDRIRETLLKARAERSPPVCDGRVIAGPNGLAIWAFADAGVLLDERYAYRALEALSDMREQLWTGERLAGRYVDEDGAPRSVAVLEDYAYLGRAAFACYGATGELSALSFALDLTDAVVEAFLVEADGRLSRRPEHDDTLIVSPQETRDLDVPSPIAVTADLLSVADRFVPHDRFEGIASRVVGGYGQRIPTDLLRHHSLALVGARVRSGRPEITISTDAVPERWPSLVANQSVYGAVLAPRPPTEEGLSEWRAELGLDAVPPIWAGRDVSTDPAVYERSQGNGTSTPPE